MPITIKHGSIFDSRADVLVCPVNCVGVMGKGLAKEFWDRFPKIRQPYKDICAMKALSPGGWTVIWDRYCLVATKDHWRDPSRIEWIDEALSRIAHPFACGSKSIAIPQLGCGCGGLDWVDVWPLYEKHLANLEATIEVWIYE